MRRNPFRPAFLPAAFPATALLTGLAAAPAWTAQKVQGQLETVVLDVDNMTCRLCPITVRRALRKVDGVVKVKAKYEGKGVGWARVTFDPSRARIEDLIQATAKAGFPSRPRHSQKE